MNNDLYLLFMKFDDSLHEKVLVNEMSYSVYVKQCTVEFRQRIVDVTWSQVKIEKLNLLK